MLQTNSLDLLFSLNSSLQQLDQDRFFKLTTEIEIVEINKLNLIESINSNFAHDRKVLENVNYWMLHRAEKYFTIVKIQDNSEGASILQQQLSQCLITQSSSDILELRLILDILFSFFEHDPFMISIGVTPDKNLLSVIFKDPIKLGSFISYEQYCDPSEEQQYQSNIFCIIPSLLKTNGRHNPVNLCKFQNALNISNSISLKYIKYSDTKFLLNLSIQNPMLARITTRILSVTQLVLWSEAEDLEILLSILQDSKSYNPDEQEFITQVDYFSNPSPNDKADIILNLLNGERIQIFNKSMPDLQIDIICSYSSKYKEQSVYLTFNGAQVIDENLRKPLQNYLSNLYHKSYICLISMLSPDPQHIDLRQLMILIEEHTDEFKRPRFKNLVQVDKKLIQKGAKLMFSIQEKLKSQVNDLKPKQKEKVISNLERLFVKFFLINNV